MFLHGMKIIMKHNTHLKKESPHFYEGSEFPISILLGELIKTYLFGIFHLHFNTPFSFTVHKLSTFDTNFMTQSEKM